MLIQFFLKQVDCDKTIFIIVLTSYPRRLIMQIIDTMKKALLLFSNLPWRQKISYNNKNFKQLFKNKSFWVIWWWIEKRKIISYNHDPDDKSLIFLFLYLTVLSVVFQLQIPFIFYTWHVYEEHNMYYQYFTHNYS